MSSKKYFSYIRVSTQRQGQNGTSLAEQQAAIERFASNWNLPIVKRFEERETAAKHGRPVFLDMLKQLRQGHANGVIIHKIDRSARNLRDWADLGSLIDNGIEVHFASESLDMNSRGGRLSADIQAVVASDYIRNLREETKKGIYGRLKQGYYPFPAVIGYLDNGKAKPKGLDPVNGPLVREAFELYGTGNFSLSNLSDHLFERGLRSKRGKKVGINALSMILHNPFYFGVIRIKKSGELFRGLHPPLITKSLFDSVQTVLAGKNIKKGTKHFFIYRRMIHCRACGNYVVAERQKGWVYYRCHTPRCSGCLKEEAVTAALEESFQSISFEPQELELFKEMAVEESGAIRKEREDRIDSLKLQLKHLEERHSRLADGYMDGIFDKEAYREKKGQLVIEEQDVKSRLSELEASDSQPSHDLLLLLELANSAHSGLKSAEGQVKRDLVKSISSNITANGKSVSIKLKTPFELIANRPSFNSGAPHRKARRTLSVYLNRLLKEISGADHRDMGLAP